jgi:hypothetical protein
MPFGNLLGKKAEQFSRCVFFSSPTPYTIIPCQWGTFGQKKWNNYFLPEQPLTTAMVVIIFSKGQ